MFRIAICSAALFGFSNALLAQQNGQEPSSKGSQESSASSSPSHIPSSGLTLEALKALPPAPDAWYPRSPVHQTWTYQPLTTGGLYPYYSFNYPYNSYVYPNGIGGYYPPRTGGYYPARFGWWF